MDKSLGLLLFSGSIAIGLTKAKKIKNANNKSRRLNEEQTFGDLITNNNLGSNQWKNWTSQNQSNKSDNNCQLKVINDTNEILIFCWVSETGKLVHFYPLNDGSIKDRSVSNSHLEYTSTGHLFVCFTTSKPLPKKLQEISGKKLVFCYRPQIPSIIHSIHLIKNNHGYFQVTVQSEEYRKSPIIDNSTKHYLNREICGFQINYEDGVFESHTDLLPTLIDDLDSISRLLPESICQCIQTSTPLWINKSLSYGDSDNPTEGKGMCFHPSEEWLQEMGFNPMKQGGIEMYTASDYLSSRSLWGVGGLLLHEFAHSIHFHYLPQGYENELVHSMYQQAMESKKYEQVAVHGPQGRDPSGGERLCKHYACTNCMEFFAELSVAFLWKNEMKAREEEEEKEKEEGEEGEEDLNQDGEENQEHKMFGDAVKDKLTDENNGEMKREEEKEDRTSQPMDEESLEFNKWFPHNRKQLKEHDIDTFDALVSIWHLIKDECDSIVREGGSEGGRERGRK